MSSFFYNQVAHSATTYDDLITLSYGDHHEDQGTMAMTMTMTMTMAMTLTMTSTI